MNASQSFLKPRHLRLISISFLTGHSWPPANLTRRVNSSSLCIQSDSGSLHRDRPARGKRNLTTTASDPSRPDQTKYPSFLLQSSCNHPYSSTAPLHHCPAILPPGKVLNLSSLCATRILTAYPVSCTVRESSAWLQCSPPSKFLSNLSQRRCLGPLWHVPAPIVSSTATPRSVSSVPRRLLQCPIAIRPNPVAVVSPDAAEVADCR